MRDDEPSLEGRHHSTSESVPAAQGDTPGDNPLAHQFDFNLMMPTISVKMVNADRLGDYEVWLFAASVCVSGAAGFLVAFGQGSPTPGGSTQHNISLLAIGTILFILFVAFFGRALWIRHALNKQAKTYSMRAQQLGQQRKDR